MAELFLTGLVIEANPKTLTCSVLRTEGGMLYNVPVVNTMGGLLNNDIQWSQNLRGSIVFYTYFSGVPYILGTLPQQIVPEKPVTINTTETETGGANERTYGATEEAVMSAGRNIDYQPNDKIIATDGGASLSLLGEGGVVLKASPLAQMIMGAGMDFMRIVARELSIFTDFGEMHFSHGSSGRNGLTIKGGAMYGDESQAGPGVNTVFMHLGDTDQNPEARFGVRVTDVNGNMFCGLVMQKNGKMVFTSAHDYVLSIGRNHDARIDGNYYTEVLGSQMWEVDGDKINRVLGDQITSILGLEARNIYKDLTTVIHGMEKHTVKKSRETAIAGSDTKKIDLGARTTVKKDKELFIGGKLKISANGIEITSEGIPEGGEEKEGSELKLKCSSFDIVKA